MDEYSQAPGSVGCASRLPSAFAGEAYTWQARVGFSTSFPLIGGKYQIYVNAHYFQTFAAHGHCMFNGNFQEVMPKDDSVELGPAVPITGPIHYNLGPKKIDLEAGLYALHITALTDCVWRFTLMSDADNPAGLAPMQIFQATPQGLVPAVTMSMRDKTHFLAQYRTDHDAKVPVSGKLQVFHNGKLVETFPLKVGPNPETTATQVFVTLQWDPAEDSAKYLGKNTAKFIVNIGGKEFTTAADFTLTQ